VESELGKGTVFSFELPITKVATDANATPDMKIANEEWFPATLLDYERPAAEKTKLNSESRPHLLVIEDNSDIVYYLQTLLENDYDVSLAFDGEDGIEHATETIPDVIISDVMMPKKDGFEVLDALKNDERTSHIPIVLLTAKGTTDDRIAGLERGADAYLSKPFHNDELFAILKNMTRQSRLLQERYAKELPAQIKTEEAPSMQVEDAFLIKIKELLEANLEDDQFGIPQICRALHMSRTQLHRKLTALTGKSTSIFIRSIRLLKVKELLQSPDMNISEVAYAVGYTDPAYFTKNFSEEFGVPPSQFQA
jgi:DNA-binding response OmpR family regulator